jgi:hypothetical protein
MLLPSRIVLLSIALTVLANQLHCCYAINITPKNSHSQIRNNLRKKMSIISSGAATLPTKVSGKDAFVNAFTSAAAAELGKEPKAISSQPKHHAPPTSTKTFNIPQKIPHPPSAMVPETKHATSTADSLLAAFAPITKPLKIDHCLPKSSDHLIKSFDAHIAPNPIQKGAPLKIFASAEFEKKFTGVSSYFIL